MVGKANADAHVLVGAVITGAVGKITILTVLLAAHEPVPAVPVNVVPQSVCNTYRACMV